MKRQLAVGCAAAAALWLGWTASARAQGYPPPPPPGAPGAAPAGPGYGAAPSLRNPFGYWRRSGLFGGIGLGAGSMQFDAIDTNETDSHSAVSLHGDIGWMFTPRLGVVLDVWGLAFGDDHYDNVTYIQTIATVGAQFYFTPILWGRLGLGSAQFSVQVDGDTAGETDTVAGWMGAVGIEALSSPRFSVDVEGRVGSGFYEDGTLTNIAIAVSVRWHALWGPIVVVQ
ncbi:MAG: hypothetical protein D6689_16250 [Deltaproteobacteria bacterium]|nr:MAG: hypothetical protein D6689_16250 [Deltaproteobacteria bacterium]